MKASFFAILIVAAPAYLLAQNVDLTVSADRLQASQRADIAAQRDTVNATFSLQQKACYQFFSVNACLDEAKQTQRDALADLKRQEISLNDADRKRKAGLKSQSIGEKLAQERPASHAATRLRPAEKSDTSAVDKTAARNASQGRQTRQQEKQAERAEKAAQAPGRRAEYEARIEAARVRQLANEQKALKARQSASAPIPLPIPK
jgi:colicin import membrane protein